MDETEVVIKIENCDSDDVDVLLARIREELAKIDDDAVTLKEENIAPSVCIKSVKDEPNSPYNSIEIIDVDDDSGSVLSNPQTVDKFIIYEIDKDDFTNNVNAMLEEPQSVESGAKRDPTKENNLYSTAQRYFPCNTEPYSNDVLRRTEPSNNLPTKANDIALNATEHTILVESSDEEEVPVLEDNTTVSANLDPLLRKSNTVTKVSNSKIVESGKGKLMVKKFAKISLPDSDDTVRKDDCHLYPDIFTKLELKDFFERMFEETRKLSMERRHIVKMELLKAVCKAEEDLEEKKICETCYPPKRQAIVRSPPLA